MWSILRKRLGIATIVALPAMGFWFPRVCQAGPIYSVFAYGSTEDGQNGINSGIFTQLFNNGNTSAAATNTLGNSVDTPLGAGLGGTRSIQASALAGPLGLGVSSQALINSQNGFSFAVNDQGFVNGGASFQIDDVLITGPPGTLSGTTINTSFNVVLVGDLKNLDNPTTFASTPGEFPTSSVDVASSVSGPGVVTSGELPGSVLNYSNNLNGPGLIQPTGGVVLTTDTFTAPVGTPFTIALSLGTSDSVQVLSGGANGDLAGSAYVLAQSGFLNTLSFPTSGPVFNLQSGFNANSAEGDIVNNNFVGGQTAAVPEPATLVVSSILFGIFGVVWSCTRLKRTTTA